MAWEHWGNYLMDPNGLMAGWDTLGIGNERENDGVRSGVSWMS